MSDGTRTRDVLDHNQVLYQLSYTHHGSGGNHHPPERDPEDIGPQEGWCTTCDSPSAFAVSASGPGGATIIASR